MNILVVVDEGVEANEDDSKKCGLIPLHTLSERVAVGSFFKMAAIPQVFFGGEGGKEGRRKWGEVFL